MDEVDIANDRAQYLLEMRIQEAQRASAQWIMRTYRAGGFDEEAKRFYRKARFERVAAKGRQIGEAVNHRSERSKEEEPGPAGFWAAPVRTD